MDILFEFIFDLFFEASFDLAENSKHKTVRRVCGAICSVLFLSVLGLILFCSVIMIKTGDTVGIIFGIALIVLDLFFVLSVAKKIRGKLK